jgi:hypothetical protein
MLVKFNRGSYLAVLFFPVLFLPVDCIGLLLLGDLILFGDLLSFSLEADRLPLWGDILFSIYVTIILGNVKVTLLATGHERFTLL